MRLTRGVSEPDTDFCCINSDRRIILRPSLADKRRQIASESVRSQRIPPHSSNTRKVGSVTERMLRFCRRIKKPTGWIHRSDLPVQFGYSHSAARVKPLGETRESRRATAQVFE
ncbi:hypothetical protein RB3587 [Rhodopirellula baltica SH 1]|uniref:Uncharacterized protein n=1 Tax=Rhodopirellula baltica (strain DSM 10527 / NCIMB 13988 / SH1) TaxID=243090 RepID=Q7UU05_RHOBA|nr:hypothetical protein RB3587 [Rhodopirellula baltica SH 1]